jgi:hypothetical protein
LEGEVKVTDIYGKSITKLAKSITLNSTPIFVQPVN